MKFGKKCRAKLRIFACMQHVGMHTADSDARPSQVME